MSRDYNGTTSAINIGSGGALDNAQPLTMALWAAAETLGEGSSGNMIGKLSSDTSTGRLNFHVRKLAGGPLIYRFFKDWSNTNMVVATTGNVAIADTNGVFHHVAFTWTGGSTAATDIVFYVDGVETAHGQDQNGSGSTNSDASLPLVIGNNGGGSRTFDGQICHVHVFRRVLSGNEIRQLMHHPASVKAAGGGIPVNTAGLLGYWPGNVFSAGVEVDQSGNQFRGVTTAAIASAKNPPVNEAFVMQTPGVPYW